MARISGKNKNPGTYFDESLQLTNYFLGSGSTYHMTPQVSDFILGSLEDMDKYIEFYYGHYVTEKQKKQVQIKKKCDNNGNTFIAPLHNVLLAQDLFDLPNIIITLLNFGHACLFYKGL